MANAPILVAEGDEEIEVDYDSDGFPIPSESAKVIDPLPPVDHSAVSEILSQNFNFVHSCTFYAFNIQYSHAFLLAKLVCPD